MKLVSCKLKQCLWWDMTKRFCSFLPTCSWDLDLKNNNKQMKYVCICVGEMWMLANTSSHSFIQAAQWWFASGMVCKDRMTEGDACLWVHDWRSPAESPFRPLIPSVTAKASLTQPGSFLWVVTRAAAATLQGRKWIYFNRTVEVGHIKTRPEFLLNFLFVKERKREPKTQENKLSLSSFPPPLPLCSSSHLSLFHPFCGKWVVCSVAHHWLNVSMSKWTQAFALFPCSPALANRPTLNVMSLVTVLTVWPGFILSHYFNCQRFHFHVNSRKESGWRSSECQRHGWNSGSCFIMIICCHSQRCREWRLSPPSVQGRLSCRSQHTYGTHTRTNLYITCHLAFNWRAEALPALVTHFSHPPVDCVCVWVR